MKQGSFLTNVSAVSLMVMIPAFQAGGPGSIPGRRILSLDLGFCGKLGKPYISPRLSSNVTKDGSLFKYFSAMAISDWWKPSFITPD